MTFSGEKVVFRILKMTFSDEKVTFSGEKVVFRNEKVTFSCIKIRFLSGFMEKVEGDGKYVGNYL